MPNLLKILGILTVLAFAAAGCRKPPAGQVWYLEQVTVGEATLAGSSSETVAPAALRTALLKALADSGRFEVLAEGKSAPSGQAPLRCQLDLAFTREAPGDGEHPGRRTVEAGVVLQLKRSGARHDASGLGRAEFAPTDLAARAAAYEQAVQSAVQGAVETLVLELTAHHRPDAELIAELGSADARRRDFAVRVLAERRTIAAVPALVERLHDPDGEVAARAIGALRAIGDPRAVHALIELSGKKSPELVVMLIDVVASLGGEEAEAWLFTLASGHPEEVVRLAAAQAEKDLKSRAERRGQADARSRQTPEPGTP